MLLPASPADQQHRKACSHQDSKRDGFGCGQEYLTVGAVGAGAAPDHVGTPYHGELVVVAIVGQLSSGGAVIDEDFVVDAVPALPD